MTSSYVTVDLPQVPYIERPLKQSFEVLQPTLQPVYSPELEKRRNDMPKCLRLVVVGGGCVGKTAVIEQAVFGKHSPGQVKFE